MPIRNKTTNLYTEWKPLIDGLPNNEAGIIFKNILSYQNGDDVNNSNPIWIFIKSKIDEYNNKLTQISEKRKENGKLGGLAKASKCYQMLASDGKCSNKTKENKTKEDKINIEKKDRFNEFWEKYKPVAGKDGTIVSKGSKSECYKRYLKSIEETDEQTIIDGVDRYLTYCKNSKVCSCGASVFINQKRWEWEFNTEQKTDQDSRFDKPLSEWTNDDFTAYAVFGGRG